MPEARVEIKPPPVAEAGQPAGRRGWHGSLFLGLVIYTLLLVVATHLPKAGGVIRYPGADKLLHFTAYGLQAALAAGVAATAGRLQGGIALLLFGGLAAFGAVDELTQPWFSRQAEVADWCADCLGVGVGIAMVMVWQKRLRARGIRDGVRHGAGSEIRMLSMAAVACAAAVGSPAAAADPDIPTLELAKRVSEEGWELAAGVRAGLVPAMLPLIGDIGDDQRRMLAGRHAWDDFVAESRVAPVWVTVLPVEAAGRRVGHRVQAAFALRTSVARFREEEAIQAVLAFPADARHASARLLTDTELRAAGLEHVGAAGETHVFVQLALLNRIQVQGVISAQRRESADGIEVAWAFDQRFDAIPGLRAVATRLSANALGGRVQEPEETYAGAAGIIVARQFPSDATGAAAKPIVVVESRLVFAEPADWFGAGNLLRAKIPLMTQEGVRSLRRRLETVGQLP